MKPTGAPPGNKRKAHEAAPTRPLKLAAIGLESEFALVVDGEQVRPEDVFHTPRTFLKGHPKHRTGTSYHLPSGGAVYFDTGVVEVVTPVIEIEPRCAARAGRSLWEGIGYVREALDAWETRAGQRANLVGFSTHYNISFDVPEQRRGNRTVEKLALLLMYVLPVPVMLLATNVRSTGVGVRPRGDRIEVTVDFTPSPSLMIATAALITGIVRALMRRASFELDTLNDLGVVVIDGFQPIPHTTRQGWLARYDCYPENPFTAGVDAPIWNVTVGRPEEDSSEATPVRNSPVRPGGSFPMPMSLREIALANTKPFRGAIHAIAGSFTYRLIRSILWGRSPSLLEMAERPPAYEDVGRLCVWNNLFPEHELSRSRYERILMLAISGRRLVLDGVPLTPLGLKGWSEVVFRNERDRSRIEMRIDYLLQHLEAWTSNGGSDE